MKDLAERTAIAFAAGVLSVIGGDRANAWDFDIGQALGVGLGTAVVTALAGLVAKNVGDAGTAGFLRTKRD